MSVMRNEYPRPQFRREQWLALNGEWEFAFDDSGDGIARQLHTGKVPLDKTIQVPFAYQTENSGIRDTAQHDVLWYRRSFLPEDGKRALLCFNGVDYLCDVWVNGHHAITHEGGFAPFSADITDYLIQGENTLVVRSVDELRDDVPRGKQSYTGQRFSCYYIPTSGIWQSVWLEYFADDCIENYSLLADLDSGAFYGEIETLYGKATEVELVASYEGRELQRVRQKLDGRHTQYRVMFPKGFEDDFRWWPHNPRLICVDFILYRNEKPVDRAHTRFGMRKISINESGRICLNNLPCYQKLVLDQGYWPQSGLTPPSIDAIRKDLELTRAMGFNGARKHQKFEDPYYYYYAEEMGLLLWCEMPSAYRFGSGEMQRLTRQWQEILQTARNFTSVVCYVPLNESWGTKDIYSDSRQQEFAVALYHLTKAMDPTRLISTNDGFDVVNPTDILPIHDYAIRKAQQFPEKYNGRYDGMSPQGMNLFARGHGYQGQPVMMTEFGGAAFTGDQKDGAWGYEQAKNGEVLLSQIGELLDGIAQTEFQGYCYTQLTDVEQEVNGLLYADRTPKIPCEQLARRQNEKPEL